MFGPRHIAFLALVVLAAIACSTAAPAANPDPLGSQASARDDRLDYDADGNPAALGAIDQALIVYTGSLSIDVADVDDALASARRVVADLGGYVASSSFSNSGTNVSAHVTYRIPAAGWEAAVAGLEALAERVVDERIGSEDVTAQVIDLDARIANLRATEAALQAIMDRATTIADVLKVQQELTRVRGDIESLTGQRDYLAQRAAFGTLDVSFNVPITAQAVAAEGWDLGREVDAALAALVRVGQWLATVLVWITLVLVPLVAPLVLLAWLAAWLRRRWLASHPRPQAPNV